MAKNTKSPVIVAADAAPVVVVDTKPTTTTEQEDDATVAAGAGPTRTTIMKVVGFQKWRAEADVSLGKETLETLDTLLTDKLNWNLVLGFELPDVTEKFPINKKYVEDAARDKFDIKPVPLRLRVANNLAWIAAKTMETAAGFVKAKGGNRIMGVHVTAAFIFVEAFFTSYTWVGTGAPPRATKDIEAAVATVQPPAAVPIVQPPAAAVTKKRAPAATAPKKTPPVKKAKTVAVGGSQ